MTTRSHWFPKPSSALQRLKQRALEAIRNDQELRFDPNALLRLLEQISERDDRIAELERRLEEAR
jgi:hypothetical protein